MKLSFEDYIKLCNILQFFSYNLLKCINAVVIPTREWW